MATARAVPQLPQTLNTLFEKMGEATAVGKQTAHAVNNVSAKVDAIDGKVDALALVVATQGHLRADVERLAETLKEQAEEIAALKATALRREGATGLIEWWVKNYPILIPLGAVAGWFGYVNGTFG